MSQEFGGWTCHGPISGFINSVQNQQKCGELSWKREGRKEDENAMFKKRRKRGEKKKKTRRILREIEEVKSIKKKIKKKNIKE